MATPPTTAATGRRGQQLDALVTETKTKYAASMKAMRALHKKKGKKLTFLV